jgi:hypothetical protein
MLFVWHLDDYGYGGAQFLLIVRATSVAGARELALAEVRSGDGMVDEDKESFILNVEPDVMYPEDTVYTE